MSGPESTGGCQRETGQQVEQEESPETSGGQMGNGRSGEMTWPERSEQGGETEGGGEL